MGDPHDRNPVESYPWTRPNDALEMQARHSQPAERKVGATESSSNPPFKGVHVSLLRLATHRIALKAYRRSAYNQYRSCPRLVWPDKCVAFDRGTPSNVVQHNLWRTLQDRRGLKLSWHVVGPANQHKDRTYSRQSSSFQLSTSLLCPQGGPTVT